MQKITTAGNAIVVAYDGKPILATDPWIGDEEPAYFGSWMLSHAIPVGLKKDISDCRYIWFSHGHPDHLNADSLPRFKANKILLPDHVNGRIFKDIAPLGYDVTILPDRRWVQLSDNIRVQCLTTVIQDAILLIDICGKLFINLNDAGTRFGARHIRRIVRGYEHSCLLALSGYGDTDMINFFAEDGSFVEPLAAQRMPVGRELSSAARALGATSVMPFSSFHQYQRADSIWAQRFTTPIDAYAEGMFPDVGYLPPFSSIDCRDLSVEAGTPVALPVTVKPPEAFGDHWSDELDKTDKQSIEDYFSRKERVRLGFGFLNFKVGGRDFTIRLQGPRDRGISFAAPRNSLMSSVNHRIFDDLLIGNFMKTTLHGVGTLYEEPGNFNFNVAKFGDNGLVESERDVRRYEAIYRRRAGVDHFADLFHDKSRDFLTRFAGADSRIYKVAKALYNTVAR
ncbi:MAG: MBL fold metallo-hydrolase [Rhodospirillales bacterium]|nr:MBL fold metallo-hydrolase [Rhodospirillales bacterium]